MIVDNWADFAAERDRQEVKWSRDPRLQLQPVQRDQMSHPPLSSAPDFHIDASGQTYTSGPYGAVWNDGGKFEHGITATGSGNIFDHPVLLQNARTAYSESIHARAVVKRYADTVIDTGLHLLPTPKAEILGITPEKAEMWADDVAKRFDCWFGSKQCTLNEINNGYQTQRAVEIFTRRDGEYFVRFHYSGRKDLVSPLQLSLVDPTQVLGYGITDTYGFNWAYTDGIIRDLGGKELKYRVMALTKDGPKERIIPAVGPRSGRRFMLHGYTPEYVDQGRGMSDYAHALQEFSNITDFSIAQIMKAISQSQFNFKVVPSKDAPASIPLGNSAGFNYNGQYENQEPLIAESNSTTGEVNHWVYSRLPEVTARIPGSTMVCGLKGGENLEEIKNSAPVEQFAAFVEALMTYLSASVSMPIEVLTQKFGRSYTASMGALILFWRVAEIGRYQQKWDWLDYVYEAWLSEEIAASRISAPGWSDPLMRQAWLSSRWSGVPMPIIDPSKQSRADKEYLEMGAQHLDDVARNYNGSDGRLNRAKLKRQSPELSVLPWTKGGGGGNPGNPGESADEDTEEGGE